MEDVPFVAGSDTSIEAANRVRPMAAAMREEIFFNIGNKGALGATCDEIEVELNFKHQTASARIRDLVKAGRLKDSGKRRPTRSGANAVVWVAA